MYSLLFAPNILQILREGMETELYEVQSTYMVAEKQKIQKKMNAR